MTQQKHKLHWRAKLSIVQVRAIRQLYATGKVSQEYLSELHKVSQGTISNIVKGKTYRNAWPYDGS